VNETDKAQASPSAREVAARAIILKHVVVYALITPPRDTLADIMTRWPAAEQERFRVDGEIKRDEFWDGLGPLRSGMSPSEREYAFSTLLTMTERQQVNASWRVEAFQVLLWALGLHHQLPPYGVEADHVQLKAFPPTDPEKFLRATTLLPRQALVDARDAAELWHWRSRTRQLVEEGQSPSQSEELLSAGLRTYDDIVRLTAAHAVQTGRIAETLDEDFVVFGQPYRALSSEQWSVVRSITMERHFALNWLCGYAGGNKWDETPTDT